MKNSYTFNPTPGCVEKKSKARNLAKAVQRPTGAKNIKYPTRRCDINMANKYTVAVGEKHFNKVTTPQRL
jgi:uncharacterized protein YycO